MEKSCKCHGLTGTCTINTCWKIMPRFVETSSRLRHRYNAAVPVKMNNDIGSLIVSRSLRRRYLERKRSRKRSGIKKFRRAAGNSTTKTRVKRRKRGGSYSVKSRRRLRKHVLSDEDLVYAQPSVDFCTRIKKGGSIGTVGRTCDPTISGAGSCQDLCCGRGYVAKSIIETKACNCKFKYCCNVECDECSVETIIHVCQ